MIRIGIDVGGTFTDLVVAEGSAERGPAVFKVPSTPEDPSIGLVDGLEAVARARGMTLRDLVARVEVIVHGTTVTTNATLTRGGAKVGLLTTAGVRDALEMRRGIRERQYDNRYTNALPLVPRHLRLPIDGRLDHAGREIEPLALEAVEKAVSTLEDEGVEAIAICFMNAFANPAHEKSAAEIVRARLPSAYLSISTRVLPSIRFYDRVSTTVLNAYVGPVLRRYLDSLVGRLASLGFGGTLLIMQSSGGVVAPALATEKAAITLLSGPAAGPRAGAAYVEAHGLRSCVTVDMGGTSFDAALVENGEATTVTEGEIERYRLALPMLRIVTIGAGGGSIGWVDEGGLLRMGPKSAGARPGPACYGRGGVEPACTDADLLLGYLDPAFFAGGRMALDREAAVRAVSKIAGPLGMSVEEAAVGMARVIDHNMAQGVRAVTVERGHDPRELPLVVAGGAGPLHACAIATELELPLMVVPRESSTFCAAGMLMADLQHDLVRSTIAPLASLDRGELGKIVDDLVAEGRAILAEEKIPDDRVRLELQLDVRYVKQYHEVRVPASIGAVRAGDLAQVAAAFHAEHDRLFGYELSKQGTPLELINVRLKAMGLTDKLVLPSEPRGPSDPSSARKGKRRAWVSDAFAEVDVYDGHGLVHGALVQGPALVEQVNTTLFVAKGFRAVRDRLGSFLVVRASSEQSLGASVRELLS
ncbi:MAG: hydantoinase/oxoprolinase family protein [Deltaproteobacteria bacterium]|nr:hydantoinase/oxoprolinase family protein [Deltaproteobacteria bacterium]